MIAKECLERSQNIFSIVTQSSQTDHPMMQREQGEENKIPSNKEGKKLGYSKGYHTPFTVEDIKKRIREVEHNISIIEKKLADPNISRKAFIFQTKQLSEHKAIKFYYEQHLGLKMKEEEMKRQQEELQQRRGLGTDFRRQSVRGDLRKQLHPWTIFAMDHYLYDQIKNKVNFLICTFYFAGID